MMCMDSKNIHKYIYIYTFSTKAINFTPDMFTLCVCFQAVELVLFLVNFKSEFLLTIGQGKCLSLCPQVHRYFLKPNLFYAFGLWYTCKQHFKSLTKLLEKSFQGEEIQNVSFKCFRVYNFRKERQKGYRLKNK